MFHNPIFLGPNGSAFRSLEDLRGEQNFSGLTREDFERVVSNLFVVTQSICRWIQTRQTIRFKPERIEPTAVLNAQSLQRLGNRDSTVERVVRR